MRSVEASPLWEAVINDLTVYTFGAAPPPPEAFDRLMELSREIGVPRWAIVSAVAEIEGRSQLAAKPIEEYASYEFIQQIASAKHRQCGILRGRTLTVGMEVQ